MALTILNIVLAGIVAFLAFSAGQLPLI